MKRWSEWEIVRHQVAVCGRVRGADAKPLENVEISLDEMPTELKERIAIAATVLGGNGIESLKSLDRTLTRADGTYFFLDLPAGRYSVKASHAVSGGSREKKLTLAWTKTGDIKREIADFELTAGQSKRG